VGFPGFAETDWSRSSIPSDEALEPIEHIGKSIDAARDGAYSVAPKASSPARRCR